MMTKIYSVFTWLVALSLSLLPLFSFSQNACDNLHVPYTEDFESYTASAYNNNNGTVPDCWTNYSTNSTYGVPHVISTDYPFAYVHSGTKSLIFTCSSTGEKAYAALPRFVEPLNTLKIHFWSAYECLTCGDLCIGYVTDTTDLENSFVYVDVVTPFAYNSGGDTISFDLSTYPNIPATGNICFYWYRPGSYFSCWIDDITVTQVDIAPETCPAPTNLMASDIFNEGVTLYWDQEEGTATHWDVNYRVQGSDTWSTFAAQITPFTLNGLTGNTDYEIQVVAHCTNGLTSDPSNTIVVHTDNVGVNDYDLDHSVSVFPNPTNGSVTISHWPLAISSVSVYDVFGKLLNVIEVNDSQVTVDFCGYAAGVYFARITTENGVVTKRIVKR